jgi:hypothetical protein
VLSHAGHQLVLILVFQRASVSVLLEYVDQYKRFPADPETQAPKRVPHIGMSERHPAACTDSKLRIRTNVASAG